MAVCAWESLMQGLTVIAQLFVSVASAFVCTGVSSRIGNRTGEWYGCWRLMVMFMPVFCF